MVQLTTCKLQCQTNTSVSGSISQQSENLYDTASHMLSNY